MLRFFVMLTLLVATVPATAAAQNATIDVSSSQTETPEPPAKRIDPSLVVQEWEYREGEFRILFVSSSSTVRRVTLTAAADTSTAQGSGNARIVSVRERKWVTFAAPKLDGTATVYLTTTASLRAGEYHWLTSDPGGGQLLTDRPPLESWTGGVVIGVGLFVGFAYLGYRRTEGTPKKARRPGR
jgi:hypothetical protein